MEKYIKYAKENKRFASAIATNAVALIASIWWLLDSNLKEGVSIQIEPIVTVLALTATLLGINYVNDKLTRPHLKVFLSMAFADLPGKGPEKSINVTVENHSMFKAFIKSFQAMLPEEKKVLQFMYEGFTDQPLPKVTIEPGQAFSFNIIKRNFGGAPQNIQKYGDFVVTTDIGYKYNVPAKVFRQHLNILLKKEI